MESQYIMIHLVIKSIVDLSAAFKVKFDGGHTENHHLIIAFFNHT